MQRAKTRASENEKARIQMRQFMTQPAAQYYPRDAADSHCEQGELHIVAGDRHMAKAKALEQAGSACAAES